MTIETRAVPWFYAQSFNGRTEPHTRDEQCTVNWRTGTCTVCGVEHGAPCPECNGRGFHAVGCKEMERS